MADRNGTGSETMAADARPTALRALECLQELALEKGLDDVSMRDVAKRLEISLAALQYHYPNKAALLDAFVSQTVEGYRRRIEAILAMSPEGERFANLVRFAAMETVQADRHGVLAMIEGRASHDDAARHAIGLFLEAYLIMMRDTLAANAPGMPPAEALLQASLVVSMLEGLPSLIKPASNLGLDREALVDGAVRAAIALAHSTQ
jgi:AcrR family transcriptional regulator